jgi:hypothetical protein
MICTTNTWDKLPQFGLAQIESRSNCHTATVFPDTGVELFVFRVDKQ